MFERSITVTIDGFEFRVKALKLDESAAWFGKGLDAMAMNREILAVAVEYNGAPLGAQVGELTIPLMTELLPHVLKINGMAGRATEDPEAAPPLPLTDPRSRPNGAGKAAGPKA